MIRAYSYSVGSMPSPEWGGWGTLTLDSRGFFGAATDYGDYIYQFPWGENEGDFREFVAHNLCCGGNDYILRKCFREHGKNTGKNYNAKKTLAIIKQHIREYRRGSWVETEKGRVLLTNYKKETAREMWDAISEHDDVETEHDFYEWANDVSHIDCEAYEFAVREWTVQAVAFRDEFLPRIRPLILAELDRERVIIWYSGQKRVEYGGVA